ncbi:MAG: tRNA preQ1(34) S-adenosylmethionine ribosyltransferase-isomerase QueA [Bacilli bacterium]|jgi:S-adenosylmethionine:tRNA ribosyltransferase-isomerase|nr:tRNA preQ1(34) S-adenosylmethionine ribosyltransferase-isomerase QueA [Bacilli bacterium]MDY0064058.1 tRNA preQ1(34) S-adenosylmethionine ribosyltransferase-isomerase QueA [Bacilli bacterium]
MNVLDFDYYLPEELIAQTPLPNRSDSKMMVLDRKKQTITHRHFYDIIDYLTEDDVLVINDTKVMPSRLYAKKTETDADMEVLLLKDLGSDCFECLIRPARRVKIGTVLDFQNRMQGTVVRKLEDGICHIQFRYQGIFLEILDQLGEMPLPPYIHVKLQDKDRYQTIYANQLGSAAAPTAGLHFTEEILNKIKNKKITIIRITLHVGLGTFRPISVNRIEDHKMHAEYYTISEEAARQLNQAKKMNKRIIAVGTTSARTLEAVYSKYNTFKSTSESTAIFIYPGYQFQAIDGLITNFHLPKSTLIMLVSAFSNRDFIINAYQTAIEKRYRFFSFGDAMFIY